MRKNSNIFKISILSLLAFQLVVGSTPYAFAQQKKSDLSITDPSVGKKLDQQLQQNRTKNKWAYDALQGKTATVPLATQAKPPRDWNKIGKNWKKINGTMAIDPER